MTKGQTFFAFEVFIPQTWWDCYFCHTFSKSQNYALITVANQTWHQTLAGGQDVK